MTVYDTDGLLIVHAVENADHVRAAQGRLHGHHPVHLSVIESWRRVEAPHVHPPRSAPPPVRHGIVARRYV
ncbi:MAG: hypothetical protein NVV57_00145 [Demequina sp.]|nr:hypothetical protein [Demequina sp.]